MPRRDGTGPMSGGRGMGGGMGRRNLSGGAGKTGGSLNAGPEFFCICPQCGTKEPHQRAQACSSVKCPQCGSAMVRE